MKQNYKAKGTYIWMLLRLFIEIPRLVDTSNKNTIANPYVNDKIINNPFKKYN